MDVSLIFSAIGTAQSVAAMLGVIDSLEAKVDRLLRSELNAGFRNLDQACSAEVERESLLREARSCFNKAVSLESGFPRGLALLGSAVCHHLLGDAINSRRCLDELIALPPAYGLTAEMAATTTDQLKDYAKGYFYGGIWVHLYKHARRLAINAERVAYRKKLVMDAVEWSKEAKSLLALQQSISAFTGKPVSWLVELEAGRF